MKSGLICLITLSVVVACRDSDPDENNIEPSQFSYSPPVTVLIKNCPPAKIHQLTPNILPPVQHSDAGFIAGRRKALIVRPRTTKATLPILSFTHYGTEQGLALSTIACGAVDRMGNLWFGTAGGGVSRFDGTNFTTFTTRQGLGHNTVRSILEDTVGNIWFGTNGGGVSRYSGTSFTTFTTKHGLTHNAIRDMIEDTNGNLWFATEGGGVSRYDGKNFTTFSAEQGLAHNTVWNIKEDKIGNLWFCTDRGLSRFDGKRFTNYTVADGLVDNSVRCMVEDKDGNLWFGTNEGVSFFDGKSFTTITTEEGLVNNIVRAIAEDRSGNLWFGTDGGLSRYDGITFINLTTGQGLINNAIRSITEDRSGNLWFGTEGGGVSRYDGTNITTFTASQGLAFNIVRSIAEDSAGNLWFATHGGGVSRYDGRSFTTFTASDGLAGNEVWSIAEDKNRSLWFGTSREGVSRYSGAGFTTFTTEQGLAHNAVRSILADKDGAVWFGTEGGGVSRYDGKDFVTFSTEHGLAHNDVRSIVEDQNGNLWFSTNGGGVSRFDGESFTTFTTAQGLASNVVWSIEEDKSGNLWFGTGSGACRYDGKSFTTFTTIQGLSDDVVYDIAEDASGVLWFGTNSGFSGLTYNSMELEGKGVRVQGVGLLAIGNEVLERMTPLWEIYNINTGYPVKSINLNAMCISKLGLPYGEKDNVGVLWGGCGDNKVIRFDPKVSIVDIGQPKVFMSSIKIEDATINWYGLGRWEKDSVIWAQQDAMVFGKLLRPGEREIIKQKFTDVRFDTLSPIYHLPQNLVVPYQHNQVSFDFGVIETGRNFLVRYQYFLEGYDKGWSAVTEKTTATYGNIQEGFYTFKLKARSPDGVWSEPIVYTFKVLPPWWRSWWAYITYGVAIVLLTVISRNQIVKRERLKNEVKLKRLEADKYHELDALKSRFFANISHEFRTPLTLLLSPLEKRLSKPNTPEDKGEFDIMHRNASRLLNLVNQLLDLSRIEAGSLKLKTVRGNLNTFISSISSQFASMAQSRSIHFEVISLSQIDLWFDPDKLEKIVVNLLSNGFKFTPTGGSISIVIATEMGHAKVEISDSGIGIPTDKIEHIFDRFYQVDDSNVREYEGTGIGLSLVKELTDLHHGTITVTSQPDQGTCFTLRIPLENGALASEEIMEGTEFKPLVKNIPMPAPVVPSPVISRDELPRVLIVEDNEDLRNYLLQSLRDKYNLLEASNGELGLNLALTEVPDLILSDLMMPKIDGLELCRQVKGNEKTSHIPVILLTAKVDQGSRIDGLETGADDYLPKPFSLPELIARIHNLIESRKKLRKLFSPAIVLRASDIKVNSLDDRFTKKVMEAIELHIQDTTFTVEVLADEVAMSTVQLYRKLKAITGQTPNDLIRNIRLDRAASLFDQRAGNVAEVAYHVGFSNLSYFAKCFKEKFNQTPSEYLKKRNT